MKRFFGLLLLCVMIALVLCSASAVAFAEQNDVTLTLDLKEEGDEVLATVTLIKNDGIADLYLRVEYDTSALTLIGRTYGNALTSLKPTDNFVKNGYEPPYRLEYLENLNATDTGILVTLRFKINEKAKNGSYPVKLIVRQVGTFSGDAVVGILYNAKYGDPVEVDIDPTSTTQGGLVVEKKNVVISGGEVTAIREEESEPSSKVLMIVLISVGAVVLVGGCAVAYILYRKKKASKK